MSTPSAPAASTIARPRPYRDFLTPAWHRKFTRAAFLTYGACFALAVLTGPKDGGWIWTIFRTLVQAALLFICSLMVFVLRVAATHVGSRTSASPLQTFTSNLFSFSNMQVVFWYLFSAWLYTETYSWSASPALRIHMIKRNDYGKQLNERAILFRLSLAITAITQAIWHFYCDKSQTPIAVPTSADVRSTESQIEEPLKQMQENASHAGMLIVEKTFFSFIACILLYYGALRSWLWEVNFSLFMALGQLDRYSRFGSITPAMSMFSIMFFQSLCLISLWDFSSLAYDAYMSQEPMKLGQPLTDGSKDPNGTLLNGMRAKREFAKSNAFWELFIIVTRFPARRATLFIEVDRQPAPTWTQISQLCLAELQGINNRIQSLNAPPPAAPTQPASRQPITQPLKQEPNLFQPAPQPQGVLALVGSGAKAIGNSPGTGYKPVLQAADWAISKGEKALPPSAVNAVQPDNLKSQANAVLKHVVALPFIGSLFRQTFAKRASAVICGAPYSHTATIVAATRSLALLVTHSLKEDRFGEVQKDVAGIIRAYNTTLSAINNFMNSLQPHWSDVEYTPETRHYVEEVELIKEALIDGLRAMVGGFGEFAGSIGLSGADLGQAKMLLGAEMSQQKMLR